ncbi:hypothetical protein HPP92_008280, partial [Vanilla planifolia]
YFQASMKNSTEFTTTEAARTLSVDRMKNADRELSERQHSGGGNCLGISIGRVFIS